MTTARSAEVDATRELFDLQDALNEYQRDIVKHVANGKSRKCTDEIMSFCMRHVCDLAPIWMHGRKGKKHFFVRPTSVSRALRRFNDDYRTELRRCADRFELAEKKFEFDDSSEPCSLYALQRVVGEKMLMDDRCIDSLYIPIHKDNHFSLLIISVPRERVIHLDSIGYDSHQDVARNVVEMLLSARLLRSSRFAMRMAKAPVQKEDWECGWCVPLFARWWRLAKADTDIDDAKKVSLEHAEIRKLCEQTLAETERILQLQNYADRLDRCFDVIASFAVVPVDVNEAAQNVSVSRPDNSCCTLNTD